MIWPTVMEQNILKLVILGHFLPFYPPLKTPKIKILKNEKFAQDIIILYMYTKSYDVYNHMMYSSWDTEWGRQNFFVILGHFVPFYPPPPPLPPFLIILKIKTLKKNEKNVWRYHFTHVHHKWQSYDVWFLRYGVWHRIFYLFGPFFVPLPL